MNMDRALENTLKAATIAVSFALVCAVFWSIGSAFYACGYHDAENRYRRLIELGQVELLIDDMTAKKRAIETENFLNEVLLREEQ